MILNLVLEPYYVSKPPNVAIYVNGTLRVNEILPERRNLKFLIMENINELRVKIIKTGKTLDIVTKEEKQEVLVKSLKLDNYNLHPNKFGDFHIKDNPYVEDKVIQTDFLTLNGEWNFKVPLWNLYNGKGGLELNESFRDSLQNCDIACFGCSFTFGWGINNNETWPTQLANLTNKKVCNYGIGGSNNKQILETALEYVKKYNATDIIIQLTHMCRLQLQHEGKYYNWYPNINDKKIKNLFKEETYKMSKFSETTVLFAGVNKSLLKKINEIKKHIIGTIYITTYIDDHYQCLKNLSNKDFYILPKYNLNKEYKLAPDNLHPGPDHNRQFVESIVQYINGKD